MVEDLKFISDPMLFGRHIVELNGTNNSLVRCYVWGLDLSGTMDGAGGVGGLLMICNFQSPIGHHFAAYDGNGNVVGLVSATTGTETARYESGPFGEPIRVTGPAANQNPFRFSSKRTCNTTDVVLYEYRAYNPTLGRWLSRDPIEEDGGYSLYCALLNSPIEYVDPDGLRPKKPKPPKEPPKLPNPAKRAAYCAAKSAAEAGLEKVGQWINRHYLCGKLRTLCIELERLPTIEELLAGENLSIGEEMWGKFRACFIECMGGSSDFTVNVQPDTGTITCNHELQAVVLRYGYTVTVTKGESELYKKHEPFVGTCGGPAYQACCYICDL